MMSKLKYKARFVLREGEVFRIIGKKRINAFAERIRYKGGTYPINLSFPTFKKKNKNIYFLNVKEIKQILVIDDDKTRNKALKSFKFEAEQLDATDSQYDLLTPKELDLVVAQGFLRALVSSIVSITKKPILLIVITLIAGAGIGWLVRDLVTGGYF